MRATAGGLVWRVLISPLCAQTCVCARSARGAAPAHRDGRLAGHRPPGPRDANGRAHQLSHHHQGALVSRRAARAASRWVSRAATHDRDARAYSSRDAAQRRKLDSHRASRRHSAAHAFPLKNGTWSTRPGLQLRRFSGAAILLAGPISEGKAKFGARDCDIVKSTPGAADRTHYAEVKTWLDPTIGFPFTLRRQ